MPSGAKKRRALRKKANASQTNEIHPKVEENAAIFEPTPIEAEDGLAVITSAAAVELAEQVAEFAVAGRGGDCSDSPTVEDGTAMKSTAAAVELTEPVAESSVAGLVGDCLDSQPVEYDLVVKSSAAAVHVELAEPPPAVVLGGDCFDSPPVENDLVVKTSSAAVHVELDEPLPAVVLGGDCFDSPPVENDLAVKTCAAAQNVELAEPPPAVGLGGDFLDSPPVVESTNSKEDLQINGNCNNETHYLEIDEDVAMEFLEKTLLDDTRSIEGGVLVGHRVLSEEVRSKFNEVIEFFQDCIKNPRSSLLEDDSVMSKEVVQNLLHEEKESLRVHRDNLIKLLKGASKTIEEQVLVVDEMRVNLQHMLADFNLILTSIQG